MNCFLSPSQQLLPPKHSVLGAPGRGDVVPQHLCASRLSAWVKKVSIVMFYGEKAFVEDRQQPALWVLFQASLTKAMLSLLVHYLHHFKRRSNKNSCFTGTF